MKDMTFLSDIFDNFYEGVYYVDTNRKILYWNKAAEQISGFQASEVVNKYCFDNLLNHVDDCGKQLCHDGCPLHATMADSQSREAGVYLHHKDGHRVAVSVRTIPIQEDGVVVGAIEVFVDDLTQHNLLKTLSNYKDLAMIDSLTKIANRRTIDSFAEIRMTEYQTLNTPFAIVMIDIDDFRNINNTYGHDVGDEVLKIVANTLKHCVRASDLVGRYGGEEFIAILIGDTYEHLSVITEKMRMLVENTFIRQKNGKIQVTISIGATQVKQNEQLVDVYKRADQLLYQSKQTGKNKVSIL